MIALLIFLLGLAIGSFLNVVIDRAPLDESIALGRSHCDGCRAPLRWFELVPIFSFLIQRGRCLRCHIKLSWQYPLVELLTGALFVWIYIRAPLGVSVGGYYVTLASAFIVVSSFIVILLADFKYQLIPDGAVIGIIVAGLGQIALSPQIGIASSGAAIGGGGVFWFLWWITRGRGMGFGDVKLAFALGLLLGFPLSLVSYYVAFLTGAAVGVILILGRKARMKTKIPFGPFLIFGAAVALGWGQHIVVWWSQYL